MSENLADQNDGGGATTPPADSKAAAPEDKNNYAESLYWNERYAKQADTLFDWYLDMSRLAPLLRLYSPLPSTASEQELDTPQTGSTPRVLHLGCGNSALTAELWDYGYRDLTNIDISDVLIQNMVRRCPS